MGESGLEFGKEEKNKETVTTTTTTALTSTAITANMNNQQNETPTSSSSSINLDLRLVDSAPDSNSGGTATSRKVKLEESAAAAQEEEEPSNSLIKKPRPVSSMSTNSDTNNNTVKQVATNIVYQNSNVRRNERLKCFSETGRQNGCTIWFTGLSCAGKTTLAFALEEYLTRERHCVAYPLDGDNIRHGLNSNLGFSREERSENIRRIGEVAKLFTDAGIICLCSFISPYAIDRERVREIHKKADLNFVEIYVKAPLEVCEQRDVKGLYKKARSGLIKDFTGVNSEYEEPYQPEVVIETSKHSIADCVKLIVKTLEEKGIIRKKEIGEDYAARELFAPKDQIDELKTKAQSYHRLNINKVEAQWAQTLSEGWAHPLRGFMNEDDYLTCLHFNYIKRDGKIYNQSVPIVLSASNEDAEKLKGQSNVSLYFEDKLIAVMNNISVFAHRKEERCAREFGVNHQGHPYQKFIWEECGDWLVGGELVVFERIKWNDGLDEYRLTPVELRQRYKDINADAVFAFQLRNPIHNGHALLMKDTRKFLLDKGYKNPVLLLHPLGGWTKDDDAPLPTRIEQHKAVLDSGEFLSPSAVIMAIFPSPMMYAGPTEVQWHAKARLNAGANYYIVGRDPAGMPHPGDPKRGDLYDATHGSRVLLSAPGLDELKIVPFRVAAYNKTTQSMEYFDPARVAEFEFISGTKMRKLAREGAQPPDGFMVPAAWNVLADYYKNLK